MRSGAVFEISEKNGVRGEFRPGRVEDIPAPIRQRAGEQIEARISAQIQLVETHFAAMHAALVSAFPEFRSLFAETATE